MRTFDSTYAFVYKFFKVMFAILVLVVIFIGLLAMCIWSVVKELFR